MDTENKTTDPNPDENLFQDADVISVYSDQMAIEDGVLVPVGRQDRVTGNLFHFLSEHFTDSKPPSCWPVDMMPWFRAKNSDDRTLAAVRGLIEQNKKEARRVYDKNIGGGIFTLTIAVKEGRIACLWIGTREGPDNKTMWLMPNGQGGMTLMLPSDY